MVSYGQNIWSKQFPFIDIFSTENPTTDALLYSLNYDFAEHAALKENVANAMPAEVQGLLSLTSVGKFWN
jgi:hypothetical protein